MIKVSVPIIFNNKGKTGSLPCKLVDTLCCDGQGESNTFAREPSLDVRTGGAEGRELN